MQGTSEHWSPNGADSPRFDIREWLNITPSPTSPPLGSTPRETGPLAADPPPANRDGGSTLKRPTLESRNEEDNEGSLLLARSQVNRPSQRSNLLRDRGEKAWQKAAAGFRTIVPRLATEQVVDRAEGAVWINSTQSSKGVAPRGPPKKRRIDPATRVGWREARAAGTCAFCFIRKVKCGKASPCPNCAKMPHSQELCIKTRLKQISAYGKGMSASFIDAYSGSILDWLPETKNITVWHSLGPSLSIDVTEYIPRTEIIDLYWKTPSGWQNLVHTPFGIRSEADLDSHAFDDYVYANIPHVLQQMEVKSGQNGPPVSTPIELEEESSLLWMRTMQTAVRYVVENRDRKVGRIVKSSLTLWIYVFFQYHGLWNFKGDNYDKLGMQALVLDAHDAQTFTPFSGTVPLPRLLHHQIHACAEARMMDLERHVVTALQQVFQEGVSGTSPTGSSDLLGLYLATWVYLTVLEELAWDACRWEMRLDKFNWPLDRKPHENRDYSTHAANTVVAHFRAAMGGRTVRHIYEGELARLTGERDPKPQTSRHRPSSLQVLEKANLLSLEKEFLQSKATAEWKAEDIKSLELKFASMLIR